MEKAEQQKFLKAFGSRLAELREAKGLSYRKMAQQCAIDHSDISRYEKGETNLTILTLAELANGLGVSVKELVDIKSY